MPKLSPVGGKRLIAILQKRGFVVVRQKGSHVRLEHPNGYKTSVPVHSSESIGKGLLRKILHDVNLSPEEFNRLR